MGKPIAGLIVAGLLLLIYFLNADIIDTCEAKRVSIAHMLMAGDKDCP